MRSSGIALDLSGFGETSSRLAELADLDFFFVVGMPKSGTTWLQNIFDSHHEIICRGETNIKQRWQIPLDKCIATYNETVLSSGFDKVYFGEWHRDYLFLAGILMMMREWLDDRGSQSIRLIGERTPNFMRNRMKTWNRYFPGSKFVHILRDPRDAAVSGWLFWSRRGINKLTSKFGTIDRFFAYYIEEWIEQVGKAREFGRQCPGRYVECRYESLVTDPQDTLAALLKYLQADASAGVLETCIADASFEKLTGRKPGEEDFSGSKFRKGTSGDWVDHIQDKGIAERYSAALGEYGY